MKYIAMILWILISGTIAQIFENNNIPFIYGFGYFSGVVGTLIIVFYDRMVKKTNKV